MHRLSTLLQVILAFNFFTSFMLLSGVVEQTLLSWPTALVFFNALFSVLGFGLLRRVTARDDEA